MEVFEASKARRAIKEEKESLKVEKGQETSPRSFVGTARSKGTTKKSAVKESLTRRRRTTKTRTKTRAKARATRTKRKAEKAKTKERARKVARAKSSTPAVLLKVKQKKSRRARP